jgi:hypothetical protein
VPAPGCDPTGRARESAALAHKLIAATCAAQGITGGQLTKTRPDPEHQLIQQPQSPGRVYAVASGHRKIVMSCREPR